jgi:phosphohistidine phosphatase
MNLYILRHADADKRDEEKFPDDNQRQLVKKGKTKTEKIAKFLKKRKIKVSLILTSPAERCREAAKIVRKELKLPKEQLVKLDCLLPEGSNADLIAEIKEKYSVDSLLIVGHDPNLSLLISQLLTGTPDLPIDLKKGGLCKLAVDELTDGKCATLELLMTPNF